MKKSLSILLSCIFLTLNAFPAMASGGPGMVSNEEKNQNQGIGNWEQTNGNWHYIYNGRKIVGWLSLDGVWYLFDKSGKMEIGWQYVDNGWYYLNESSEGALGKMLVGWQQINGEWYYFEDDHNGNYGRMYKNTTTEDGYKIGNNGTIVS